MTAASEDFMTYLREQLEEAFQERLWHGSAPPSALPEVAKVASWMPVSSDLLYPQPVPPPWPLTRRQRFGRWRREQMTVYAIRAALAHRLDPDPYKEDRYA